MIHQSHDLKTLRETASRALLTVLWLHVPICLTIGLMRGGDWLLPVIFAAAMAVAATLSWHRTGNGLSTRLIFAVALMADVSIFTYQLAGHAWQIDMHMYFFAALACLVAYCDYRPIVAGTVAVALHHLTLNFLLPAAIYPGGADFGRVVLHAVILIIEAGVLIALAHKLANLFDTAAKKTAEAEAASAAEIHANAERVEVEKRAKQDRDGARRELASGFERTIGHIVESVAVAAQDIQQLSTSISGNSRATAEQATAAAAASTRASTNVETVAAATEELTASIGEIAKQVTRSAEIAGQAAEEAKRTNAVVEGLASGTQKIGEVVTLIQNIASQTNLLALNATRRRPRRFPRRSKASRTRLAMPSTQSRPSLAPLRRSTRYPARSRFRSISRARQRAKSPATCFRRPMAPGKSAATSTASPMLPTKLASRPAVFSMPPMACRRSRDG
jgi:methyl-accepting chemotaxis protein